MGILRTMKHEAVLLFGREILSGPLSKAYHGLFTPLQFVSHEQQS